MTELEELKHRIKVGKYYRNTSLIWYAPLTQEMRTYLDSENNHYEQVEIKSGFQKKTPAFKVFWYIKLDA